MKMKMKIKILLSLIVVLVIGFFIGRGSVKAKEISFDIASNFFTDDCRDYVRNMTVYNDETVTSNGFIFTLESSIYVKKCNVGYYIVSIKQENGKSDMLEAGIQLTSMGGRLEKEELRGNTLYYYFCKTEMFEEDVLQMACSDAENKDTKGDFGIIKFNVVNNDGIEVKSFSSENYECNISPVGFSILHKNDIDIDEVKFGFENEDDETIFYLPTQKILDHEVDFDNVVIRHSSFGWDYYKDMSWNTPTGMNRFTYFLDNWYDIDKVSSITVNGEKLELK